jgi:hypothetical protein
MLTTSKSCQFSDTVYIVYVFLYIICTFLGYIIIMWNQNMAITT